MTSTEDLFDNALSMIDLRRWGLRGRIFCEIRKLQRTSIDGWAYIGARTLAERLCCSHRYVYQLVGANTAGHKGVGVMWRVERILMRDSVGAGTRGTAYKVNPHIDQWRSVPWVETNRESRRARLEAAQRAAYRGANEGLAPRSHIAALADLAPRSHGAALNSLAPRSISRHKGLTSAAIWDRGASSDAPAPSPSSLNLRSTAREQEQQTAAQQRVIEAVEAKTGARVYGMGLKSQILALVAEHDVPTILAAVDAAPAGYKPPRVVGYAEAVCAGDITLMGAARPRPTVDLAGRARKLRQLIATHEAEGEDTTKLVAELAECENGLTPPQEGRS